MAATPLQGWTVPSGTQAPATAADIATLAQSAEAQAVMTFATPAAMDALIPPASRKAGMIAWIASLGRHVRVTSAAQAGTLGPLSLLGSVVVDVTLVGTYDASKPLKLWLINRSVATDNSGDGVILSDATIGSGCVLAGVLVGADVFNISAALRGSSGALKARVWNAGALFTSSSAVMQGWVIGQ